MNPDQGDGPENLISKSDELERPSVLIVDTDAKRLFALESMLNCLDVTLFEADAARDVIKLQKKQDFAAILIRATRGDMDVYSLTHYLQTHQDTRQAPVIFITPSYQEERCELLDFSAGNLELMLEPVIQPVLVGKVASMLTLFQYRRALGMEMMKRRRLEEKLKETSRTDQLTFIANRRFFRQQYAVEWRRLLRDQRPFSLIMLDIDFFELYRDTYGQELSDLCIIKVGKELSRCVARAADFVARIEDAGFAVVLPDTAAEGARKVAKSIRESIRRLALEHASSPSGRWVTVSQGVGEVITNPSIEPNELIALADHALFQAKKKGGDQIVVSEFRPANPSMSSR